MTGENFDLWGFPIPEPRDAGRPEHEPTDENRIKIMMMLVFGKSVADIAKALGLSQPTLRKHYFQQLDQRKVARLQLEATRWGKLYELMLEGSVSASKELGKLLTAHDLTEIQARVMERKDKPATKAEKTPKAETPGKKEQQKIDAQQVVGIFAPPPPPDRFN